MMLTPEQLAKWRRAVNNLLWSTTISSSQLEAFLNHIDAQQARIAELEQDAVRYRWLRDNGELPMVIIGSRWYGTQHAGCLDLNEFVDSEMQK